MVLIIIVADIHLRIGNTKTLIRCIARTLASVFARSNDCTLGALSATEDVAGDAVGDMVDINDGRGDGSISRSIGGQVGASIEVGEVQGTGGLFVGDIDGNETSDIAVDIGTAEDVGNSTAV